MFANILSDAAKAIAPEAGARRAWMSAQKDALKSGRIDEVLRALAPHREPAEASDEQAPVRACHRYISARKHQLKYPEAMAEGLPIGSGEIESAHRYGAQKRLKLPGAWWRVEHAEHMLARAQDQPPQWRLGGLLVHARRERPDPCKS
jgi:hypothetical protein